jgi:uncharacterized integral membrane protein
VANRDAVEPHQRRIPPALVGAVLLAAIVLIFVFQNTHRVPIHFLWFEKDAQLWLMLLITAAVAIASAELFSVYLRRRREDS